MNNYAGVSFVLQQTHRFSVVHTRLQVGPIRLSAFGSKLQNIPSSLALHIPTVCYHLFINNFVNYQILMFAMGNPEQSLMDNYHRKNNRLLNRHPAKHILNETLETDLACQKEALGEGLRGAYVAMLSTSKRSLNHLLRHQQHNSLPFVNIKVSFP